MKALAFLSICVIIATGQATTGPRTNQRQTPVMSPDQVNRDALTARISQAQIVVSGTVTAVEAPLAEGPPGLSMHSPSWTRATIAVQSVLKGGDVGKSLTVFFPSSNDVMWSKAPKLAKGQHGVWLVQGKDLAKGAPGLAVIDPLDAHHIDDLPKIQTLLKSPASGNQ